jgi:hypothetical protein
VEAALAVMRLSCEKFFLLCAALVSHLLYGARPPPAARAFIRTVAALSNFSQRVSSYLTPINACVHRFPCRACLECIVIDGMHSLFI